MTDGSGSLIARQSFDAWGRPRDIKTWGLHEVDLANPEQALALQPTAFFDRGYTGHEHMAGFGLINMNGRVYDPYLQRFLSPDPFVQAPTNAQNYNRYSYVLNNPLMYTDPSGYSYLNSMKTINVGSGFYYRGEYLKWNSFTQCYYSLRTGRNYGGEPGGIGSGYTFLLQVNAWAPKGTMGYKLGVLYSVAKWVSVWNGGDMQRKGDAQGGDDLMAGALAFAAMAAVIDGPLLIGDAVAIATIAAVGAYVVALEVIRAYTENPVFGDPRRWTYTYQHPSQSPLNNAPRGYDPNEPPGDMGWAAKWIVGLKLLYEAYDEYRNHNKNLPPFPMPETQTDKTYVAPSYYPYGPR